MMEAAKPSSASSIAGARTSARGSRPKRAVQGEPAVHGARHGDAAYVTAQRHDGHAVGPQARRVGTRSGTPDGEERLGP